MTAITKNHELLFMYDAKMCNPNGDPDNENRPRIDVATSTNIVTDVRLKRYIRDYLMVHEGQELYVANPEGIVLNATDRLKFWKWRQANPDGKPDAEKARNVKLKGLESDEVLKAFIDTRLFGATITIKGKEVPPIQITGPVQLNWGTSFNKVEMADTSAITSHLSSEKGAQGTIGADYRLYYSLLGFHGVVCAKRAAETGLSAEDIALMDKAFVKSIPLMATRSKIGQYPRLYLRVTYTSDDFLLGDLRKYIVLEKVTGLRSIKDVKLDAKALWAAFNACKAIESISYWMDDDMKACLSPGIDAFKGTAIEIKS